MSQPDLLPPDDVAARICCVILFKDGTEMENWLKDKTKLEALKKAYKPRTHHCWMNKDTLQITIYKRSICSN